MDLSQQELPLTTYFSKGKKETRSRALLCKKDKPTENSQSTGRASKRRRSDAQCSTASPSSQSRPGKRTLQLPTPATSTRKRMCDGRRGPLAQTPPTPANLSSAERNVLPLNKKDLALLEYGSTPLKCPQSLLPGVNDTRMRLTTPSTDGSHVEGIATPRTIPRGIPKTDNHSASACSDYHLPSELSQASSGSPTSEVSYTVLPLQHLERSTVCPLYLPPDPNGADPFCPREKSNIFGQRDTALAQTSTQYSTRPKTPDGQTLGEHAIPVLPVPSSQSQYLLHLDATPSKRKRFSQDIEHIISSQTQEERELTLPMPNRPIAMVGLLTGIPLGKDIRGNVETLRLNSNQQKSHHVYTHGSTPVVLPDVSPARPLRPFHSPKKSLDEIEPRPSSTSQRGRSTPYHSPCYKAKAPGRPCCNSVENIPSSHTEDSFTEPESELDILRTKGELFALVLPSREMNQVLCHSPITRGTSPPDRSGFPQDNLPGVEDDSVTEAESDTEILHCVAEIGRKRPRDHGLGEDTPRSPVISPLVSPARPRIAPVPSITSSTQSITGEGAGASIPSAMQQLQIPPESLPSVVRDFFCMFPGDESYPVDFPESLRI